jgi:photosystem II stability/assembly factor-like uncharacterized protein
MKKLLLSVFVLSAIGASAQWTEQYSGFTTPFRGIGEINVVDANVVWATGTDGATGSAVLEATHTTDGGATWTATAIDLGDPNLQVTNIQGIDGSTAFVGAFDPVDDAGLGGVFKTTDGGVTWESMNPAGYTTAGASWFNFVHFFNANEGLTQGDPTSNLGEFEIYRTVDGGTTWTPVPAAIPNAASGEYGYNGGVATAGNSLWFTTNKGKLYRTVDKGATWVKLNAPASLGVFDFGSAAKNGRVFFSDNNNGILIATINSGDTYTLFKTSNGGTTWAAGVPYTQPYLYNLSYIPGTSALVGTGATELTPAPNQTFAYYTGLSSDNGSTWTLIDSEQKTAIDFISATTGWAGGFTDLTSTEGGIFKYTGAALGLPSVARAQFSVSPNPTTGMLQVANDNAAITDVAVYDITGKQVYTGKFSSLNQVDLDLTPLNTGAYFLKATSDTGATQTIKIMKN